MRPQVFTSVEQRMGYTYVEKFPEFYPAEEFSAAEQEVFYRLMERLYRLAYDEPELFAPKFHEDDVYPNRFNRTAYGKPELILRMRKFTKELDGLVEKMFELGQGGEVKLSRRQRGVLERLGVDYSRELPPAWRWMAERPGATVTAFGACLFRKDYPYIPNLYAQLLGEEKAFRKLESWMTERGYRRYDCLNVTASDNRLSMTYANPAWSGDVPGGGFEYRIKHTGISCRYDRWIAEPAVIGLCIPGGLKSFLERFSEMDGELQDFVAGQTKLCDNCRYCVQADKSGRRPLAAMVVKHGGETLGLCPYFPGCYYNWTEIDHALSDRLIRMLDFMDRIGREKWPKTAE